MLKSRSTFCLSKVFCKESILVLTIDLSAINIKSLDVVQLGDRWAWYLHLHGGGTVIHQWLQTSECPSPNPSYLRLLTPKYHHRRCVGGTSELPCLSLYRKKSDYWFPSLCYCSVCYCFISWAAFAKSTLVICLLGSRFTFLYFLL